MDDYNIRKHLPEFWEFLQVINELKQAENYDLIKKKVEILNKYIGSIIENSKDDCCREFKVDQDKMNEIENQIKEFYESFFRCFVNEEEIFTFLFETVSQIYRKRIYQLNHIFGIIKHKLKEELKENSIFRIYTYSNLYLDYYESFGLFLKPFVLKRFEKERDKQPYYGIGATNLLHFLFPTFFECKVLNFLGSDPKYKGIDWLFDHRIRNNIAHSNYLIDSTDFVLKYKKNRDLRKKGNYGKIPEVEAKYAFLKQFIVMFTTVLDFKINRLFLKSKNPKLNKYWGIYFDKYYKSWDDFINLMLKRDFNKPKSRNL